MSSDDKKKEKIVNIDARIENADWPKRTDDTFMGLIRRAREERRLRKLSSERHRELREQDLGKGLEDKH